MPEKIKVGSVAYENPGEAYFKKRELRRFAGVWSLWALGVGAVLSGHFSGWNFGLEHGFGPMLVASVIIMLMYLGLTFSIAEMSPALPHTGGAYSFARSTMGPWGGFVTGLAENIEYVLTPAVINFFIGAYLTAIFGTPPEYQPLWWLGAYVVFVALNIWGVEFSFRIALVVTIAALGVLAIFWASAIPIMDFSRWTLNIAADGSALPEGDGSFFPMGYGGILAALPFAVWLFLAIEQLPLASEETHNPKLDMPRGIIAGMFTLMFSAFMILFLNTGVSPGAYGIARSSEPLLDGFRATFGGVTASGLALAAVIGLIASFHSIIFAFGRQIYSLSRAGYFPRGLSITHTTRKTPYIALITGAALGYLVMLVIWFALGSKAGGAVIGATLLNMAVFGAMISYFFQAVSFIRLRRVMPHIERPYKSPLGIGGAALTLIIAAVTLFYQLQDPVYQLGVYGAAAWYVLGIIYFALIGRHKLVLSPEEEFALSNGAKGIPKA